jgi:hypothetical protein
LGHGDGVFYRRHPEYAREGAVMNWINASDKREMRECIALANRNLLNAAELKAAIGKIIDEASNRFWRERGI